MDRKELPAPIQVAAYSGYKANERPLSFVLEHKELAVVRVVDRWFGVEHDGFKVLAEDGKIYVIRWNRIQDVWLLVKIMDPEHKPSGS